MGVGNIATPNTQPQPMFATVTLTIEPNDKYHEVIRGEPEFDETPETDAECREQADHHDAAEAYQQTINNTLDAADYVDDPDDLPTLSWDDISPSSDPDLLAKIATYFDGMEPDEPTDALRAKCRLLNVEVYADAQIAATAELKDA